MRHDLVALQDAVRSARWALRALPEVRQQLRRGGVAADVPAPPFQRGRTLRGVRLALRLRSATCLERSLVLQRWWLSQGVARDVLVGVAHEDGEVLAHAWLEGDEHKNDRIYVVMTRAPASSTCPSES